jgi:hypothetical protein
VTALTDVHTHPHRSTTPPPPDETSSDRPGSGGDRDPPHDAHATSTVPQKRKAQHEDASEPAPSCVVEVDGEEDDELPDGEGDEYVSGKITCDACGEAVAFRDPDSGRLQIEKWDAHRREWCVHAAFLLDVPLSVSY